MREEYPAWNGGEVRIINGERRYGVYVDGECIDMGRAVIAMTVHHVETGYYKMEWIPESMDTKSPPPGPEDLR